MMKLLALQTVLRDKTSLTYILNQVHIYIKKHNQNLNKYQQLMLYYQPPLNNR